MKRQRSSSPRDHVPQEKPPNFIIKQGLEVEKRFLPLILPCLSLCDLDSIARSSFTSNNLVVNYINLHGAKIEECCLLTHPIGEGAETYKKWGKISTTLTLKNLPASVAIELFRHFNHLQSLTLTNMIILDGTFMTHFPSHLKELILIDCKIGERSLKWWLKELYYHLKTLKLQNFKLWEYRPYEDAVNLGKLEYLEYLVVEGDALHFNINSSRLKCLQIRSDNVQFTDELHSRVGVLFWEIHFDCPSDQWNKVDITNFHNSLWRLTTRNLLPLEQLRKLSRLNEMEVLCPVDLQYKDGIEALNINTVKVIYNSASHPPKETNLIFKKLNDDCLIAIISRLKVPEWMGLGKVHPKIERVLAEHFYPRAVITDKDIAESKIAEDLPYFQHVAHFITEYQCDRELKYISLLKDHLTALTSLTLRNVMARKVPIEVWSFGLQKLVFDSCSFYPITPLFNRLHSTLRVLEIIGSSTLFAIPSLNNLRNLREFKFVHYHICNLNLFWDNNVSSLERLEITELSFESDWGALADVLEPIKSMKKLRVLGIRNDRLQMTENFHLVADLVENVGPQLRKLIITFSGAKMKQMLECKRLKDLEELDIIIRDYDQEIAETAIAFIPSMKNLRKLRIEIHHPYLLPTLPATDLLILVKSLPKLIAIEAPFEENGSCGPEFREYLRKEKRTIKVNGVTFLCHRL